MVVALNKYRTQNGLKAIPFSLALMTVAQYEANALVQYPSMIAGTCKSLSWPAPPLNGLWTACCDATGPTCPLGKPQEITKNWVYPFPSSGSTVIYAGSVSGSFTNGEQSIINLWLGSGSGLPKYLLQQDGKVYNSIGVGYSTSGTGNSKIARAYLFLSTATDQNVFVSDGSGNIPLGNSTGVFSSTMEDTTNLPTTAMNILLIGLLAGGCGLLVLIFMAIIVVAFVRHRRSQIQGNAYNIMGDTTESPSF